MGIRPVFLAALVCAVLGLAAFVTTTSDGAVRPSGADVSLVDDEENETTCAPGEDCRDSRQDQAQDERRVSIHLPGWLFQLFTLPVVLLGVVLALIVARRLRLVRRRRRERAPARPRGAPPGSPARPTEEVEELGEELVRQAAALYDGEPRNAIVAAWVALEQAAARAGVRPDRTETPTEFAQRAAAAYRLDGDALARLADLYREARFSRHELTSEHIAQARRSLGTLAHDLRFGAHHGATR